MTQLAAHRGALRFLTLPSGKVAVLDAEPAVPRRGTAVLVPGFTGSKEDFAPLLDPLAAQGYRVLALDLPGQYQSPGPPERDAYTVNWLGSVLNEVVASLGEEPVHLLGHSFGGLVARAAVVAQPGRYRSLILLCSGPAGIEGGRKERMERLEPLAEYGIDAVYAALAQELAADPAAVEVPAPLAEFLRDRFLNSSVAGLFGMGHAIRAEPDLVADLRATAVPALVCFGANDDAWPPAVQRDMAARLDAPVVVIDGAAHSPPVEQSALTVAALSTFWRGTA